MKILHICIQAPGHRSGGDIAILQSSYALSKIADEVDYIGPYFEDEDIRSYYHDLKYLNVKPNALQKLYSIMRLELDRNFISWKKLDKSFDRYDIIYIEFTKKSYLLKDILKSGYKGKVIVRSHNVEQDFYRIEHGIEKTVVSYINYVTIAKRERYMLEHADKVVSITANDKARITEVYGISPDKIEVCPVGYSLPDPDKKFTGEIGEKLKCLITGSLWFGPNAEGILWFVDNVYHKVKDFCQLTVAGSNPTDSIREICQKENIRMIESPDSMDPYYEETDLALVPIFSGGGMKVKVAVAMSFGLPVVTTPHGAIGYEIENGVNGFVTDSPEEFADAVIRFYQMTAQERKQFTENCWKLYCDKYSLDAIKVYCENIIDNL